METKNLRSYVLLDETKYRHNIRTLLQSGKKMIAVIKANAYGFGDLEAKVYHRPGIGDVDTDLRGSKSLGVLV